MFARRIIIAALVIGLSGFAALALRTPSAHAVCQSVECGGSIDVYWGFGWLSPSNPPAGTCRYFPAGYACSSQNYYQQSQVQINTNGLVELGFIDNQGTAYEVSRSGPGTFTVDRSGFPFVPAYNRVICSHGAVAQYVQCRGLF
jgi:hypothetical protein